MVRRDDVPYLFVSSPTDNYGGRRRRLSRLLTSPRRARCRAAAAPHVAATLVPRAAPLVTFLSVV